MVVFVFALLAYVLLPLGMACFEHVYLSHVKQRALAMTDAAVFSLAAKIDSEAYSEARIVLRSEDILSLLEDRAGVIVPERVRVSQSGGLVTIEFEFLYPKVFSRRAEKLRVRAVYDFEMLSEPAY